MSNLLKAVPSTIPGLIAWYDSSVTSSVVKSNNLVSKWKDISGNKFDLKQIPDFNKPSLVGDYITFNGSSSFLYNWDLIKILDQKKDSFSIFIAFRTSDFLKNDQTIMASCIDGNQNEWVLQIRFSQLALGVWSGVLDQSWSADFVSNKTNNLTYINSNNYPSADTTLYLNDKIENSYTNRPSVATSGNIMTVGCLPNIEKFFKGNIFEIMCYDRVLPKKNVISLQNYMTSKWL